VDQQTKKELSTEKTGAWQVWWAGIAIITTIAFFISLIGKGKAVGYFIAWLLLVMGHSVLVHRSYKKAIKYLV